MPADTEIRNKQLGDRQDDAAGAPPRRRNWLRQHAVKAAVAFILVVAIAAAAFLWWRYTTTYEDTDDAQIDGHLNDISARVPGTITAVHAVENQSVTQGQLLIELDSRDYSVELQRAQANLSQAQAQVQAETPTVPITRTTSQAHISIARSNLAGAQAGVAAAERDYQAQLARLVKAEAGNQQAEADLQRYSTLVSKDEVSRQDYDQRVAAAKAAAATVETERAAAAAAQRVIEQRQAAVEQARSQLEQATTNAPQELSAQRANVAWRRAAVQSAQTALEQARLNLSYVKITAPVSGVVGRKAAEAGMRVQPGQSLLAIVPLDDIWVTAKFKETQLRRIRPGQSARIHVDAFDRDYDGYVESMAAATSALFSVLPPENASGNFVKVVQRLPVRLRFKPGQDPNHELRPGMSAVPKIWLK